MKVLSNSVDNIKKAGKAIREGNLVIFPTETVYGLGADATNIKAVEKIFIAKTRPSNNPLIVHLARKEDISLYAKVNSLMEQKLIDRFMPGPFTLVLEKKDIVPGIVTANLDSVGIRIPSNPIAHEFLMECRVPIAAPSANISSKPSGTNITDIKDEFMDTVEYIVDGGKSKVGLESTVVKVIDNIPTILRPGYITKEDIISECGSCNVIKEVLEKPNTDKVLSPGILYKHYAPSSKCLLVYSDNKDNLINLVKSNLIDKTLIIGSSKLKDISCFKYLFYGDDLETIAHNMFSLLRKADTYNPELIIIEGVKKEGLGLAIMNRLLRSASFNYIEK